MITLPKSLKEIGDEAFSGCEGMDGQTVVIPKCMEKLGKQAFLGTEIDGITVRDYEEEETNE